MAKQAPEKNSVGHSKNSVGYDEASRPMEKKFLWLRRGIATNGKKILLGAMKINTPHHPCGHRKARSG
jgi:hypothetical protein